MVSRNKEWGLLGRDKPEPDQRKVCGPFWIQLPCSQTRPGICSETRPGISLCSLSELSLPDRGQFLILLNQSKQDRKPLSALALDCLCQTVLTTWSVRLPYHRTIQLFLLLFKIIFPGPVGARLLANQGPDRSGSCLILVRQQPDQSGCRLILVWPVSE